MGQHPAAGRRTVLVQNALQFRSLLSGRCLPCCKASSISLVDSALSLPCLLGASQSGLLKARPFPVNSRIVAAWFPAQERGTAVSIFNSAQYFATVIFAPIMGWLTHEVG
ncbi:MFS transporter [Escherichia coli]